MLKENNLKVITFLSAKGGVGKSSLIVNIANLLKRENFESLILDTNFIFPNIDIYLGEDRSLQTLKYSVIEEKNLLDFIKTSKNGIKYVSLPIPDFLEKQNTTGFNKEIIKFIKRNIFNLDFILIDTPVGISEDIIFLTVHSDRVIVITSPELASLSNTYILLKLLFKKTAILPEILINKVSTEKEAVEIYEDLKRTVKNILKMEIKYLGFTYEDKYLEKSIKTGNLLIKRFHTPYISSLKRISEKLTNNHGGL